MDEPLPSLTSSPLKKPEFLETARPDEFFDHTGTPSTGGFHKVFPSLRGTRECWYYRLGDGGRAMPLLGNSPDLTILAGNAGQYE